MESNDLEQARRSSTNKITITDLAIQKVPLIEYPGIPNEHYEIIQQIAKSVLTISRDLNECNEVAITYSLDSERLMREGKEYYGIALGDQTSVDPCDDSTTYHLLNSSSRNVVITVHNHPSVSLLSLADVSFLLEYASVKMIIAVTNLGGIFYLLKTEKYVYDDAVILFRKAANIRAGDTSLRARQEAAQYFLNHCKSAGLYYGDR